MSKQQLRGPSYERLLKDVYVLRQQDVAADDDGDPSEAAERRQVVLRLSAVELALPGAIACWHTSAVLQRLPVPRCDEIHVARPTAASRSERNGVVVHRMSLDDDEVRKLDGLQLTSGPRTFVDLAALLTLEELAAVGDVVLRRWGEEAMAKAVARAGGRRGVVEARTALPLLDGRSGSAAETRARLRARAAGFTSLRHGVVVKDEGGQWLAAPDLADEIARIAVQHDGEVHWTDRTPTARRGDLMRDENTRDADWQVVVTTSREDRQPHLFLQRLTHAYLRQARLLGDEVLPPHLRERRCA